MSTDKSTSKTIEFSAQLEILNGRPILRLPGEASAELPSRGQVAVHAQANGVDFTTVLEPDGLRGHWISVSDEMLCRLSAIAADTVAVSLTPTKE